MIIYLRHVILLYLRRTWKIRVFLSVAACSCVFAAAGPRIYAQQTDEPQAPVVVQPGAPGKPTKSLPPTTKGNLPPASPADVLFMQGMITHHAQAVEMTALIESRTENKEIRSLGVRISRSQDEEIKLMKRWLASRDHPISQTMHEAHYKHMSHDLMPGMLSSEQMEALRKAKGEKFDQLFLKGMIQHHGGALIMVKDLFDSAGAGQDAELFNFATDVDSGQRAEIRIMQNMLESKPLKDK
jgi:uncharacterized protein (DUF305 family)